MRTILGIRWQRYFEPLSNTMKRQGIAAVIFAIVTLVSWWLLRRVLYVNPDQLLIMATGTALYVVLSWLSVKSELDFPVGLQHVATLMVFLAAGTFPVLVVALLGATVAHFLQVAARPTFRLRRDIPLTSTISIMFDACINSSIGLLAGGAFLASGGDIGLTAITSAHVVPLLVCYLTTVTAAMLITLGLGYGTTTDRRTFGNHLAFFVSYLLVNLLTVPLAILLGLGYETMLVMGVWLALHILPILAALGFSIVFRHVAYAYARIHELEFLQRVQQTLNATLDINDLLMRTYELVKHVAPAEQFYVGLQSIRANKLTFPLFVERDQPSEHSPDPLSQQLAAYLARRRSSLQWQPLVLRGSVRTQSALLNVRDAGGGDLACYVGLPLVTSNRLIGVLTVQDSLNPAAFTDAQIARLTIIASYLAPLLRNADQYTQVFELADSLALLNNVSTVVSATIDLNTVLDTICNVIIEVGHADKIGIFLADDSRQRVHLEFQMYLNDAFVAGFAKVADAEDSGPRQALQQWTAQVVADIYDPDADPSWRLLAALDPFVSLLIVPLITDNRVIGFVAAFYTQPHECTPSELDLFNTLANQVAVTVSNARLHQDTERRAAELATLVEYSRSFTATLDLHDVVRSVLDAIAALVAPDIMVLAEAAEITPGTPIPIIGQRGVKALETLLPTGSMSHAFESRQPLWLRAEAQEPNELLADLGVQALYILPLINQDEAFGLALLGFHRASTFDERKGQLAQAVLHQASTAIKNAQLFAKVDTALDERVNELYGIAALSRKVSASLDMDEIVDEVLSIALRVTNADVAGFALTLSADPDFLTCVQQFSPAQHLMRSVTLLPRDRGIIGQALRTGETIAIADVRNHPEYYPSPVSDIRSELAVPIIFEERVLGVINLECRRLDAFSATHRSFMSLMADHIGATVRNARLFTERQTQLENLIELRNLSLQLLSTTGFKEALRLIVMYTMTIMRARDVHLYLYDTEADTLTFGASMWADGRENIETHKPTSSGRTWRVAHTGQMFLIPDTKKEHPANEPPNGQPYGAVARVPIKRGDQVFGVLVISFNDPQYFDESKIRTLELVSSQAAIAIENARLFDEVRTRREQLEAIIQASRDGIGLVNMQGKLVLVNEAAERLMNRPLHFYEGQHLFRLLALIRRAEKLPDNPDNFSAGLPAILQSIKDAPDQPTKRNFSVQTANGQRDIEERTLPVKDADGKLNGRLLLLRDISEEKAEERFREEVTNMLIHDLRAPTANMITSLRMIIDLIDMKEFEDLRFVSNVALEGGERLMKMITLLLELARSEALETAPHPLTHILQSAIFALEANAKEANISIINCVPETFPLLQIDESKINRVFVNLLDNALRHTPSGGEVRFGAEVITHNGDAFAKISVIDTGVGIPEEFWKKIFAKFVQLPKSSLRGHKGTGLGLTFCQKVVEAHHGSIWVDRGPQGGAAFWLTLPLASASLSDSEPTNGQLPLVLPEFPDRAAASH
jgi:GAF domain-containing protein